MTPSPYSGLTPGRRRRISADDAAHPPWRPLGHLLPALSRMGDPALSTACPPLSDTDVRGLVEEALSQTLSAIATGHLSRDRPVLPT